MLKSTARFICILLSLSLPGWVGAQSPEDRQPGTIPVDYPPQESLNATVGQLAIGIDPYRLKDAWKRSTSMIAYTNFVIVDVGSFESKVKRVSATTLPNSLLIPFPKGESVAVGDILLTWWQTGGGMHWAIVVGGTPTEPVVRYLTLPRNIKDFGKEHTLKPDSYSKLDTPFEVGTNVVFPVGKYWSMGTILNQTADSFLLMSSNKLKVIPKATAKAVPPHPGTLTPNQVVHVAKFGRVGSGKVVSVDPKLGQATILLDFFSKKEEVIPFTQIYTGAL